jgi:hypothetical protein
VLQATFEDSLAEEAVAKKHCTTSEAVQAGVQAGAYRTLLTHFSQRYPKIPVVDDNFRVCPAPLGLTSLGCWQECSLCGLPLEVAQPGLARGGCPPRCPAGDGWHRV